MYYQWFHLLFSFLRQWNLISSGSQNHHLFGMLLLPNQMLHLENQSIIVRCADRLKHTTHLVVLKLNFFRAQILSQLHIYFERVCFRLLLQYTESGVKKFEKSHLTQFSHFISFYFLTLRSASQLYWPSIQSRWERWYRSELLKLAKWSRDL